MALYIVPIFILLFCIRFGLLYHFSSLFSVLSKQQGVCLLNIFVGIRFYASIIPHFQVVCPFSVKDCFLLVCIVRSPSAAVIKYFYIWRRSLLYKSSLVNDSWFCPCMVWLPFFIVGCRLILILRDMFSGAYVSVPDQFVVFFYCNSLTLLYTDLGPTWHHKYI